MRKDKGKKEGVRGGDDRDLYMLSSMFIIERSLGCSSPLPSHQIISSLSYTSVCVSESSDNRPVDVKVDKFGLVELLFTSKFKNQLALHCQLKVEHAKHGTTVQATGQVKSLILVVIC